MHYSRVRDGALPARRRVAARSSTPRAPTRSRSSRTSAPAASGAFAFLDEHAIDCVYTCLEPSEFAQGLRRTTRASRSWSRTCPATCSDHAAPRRAALRRSPDAERTSTSATAAARCPAYLGRGAHGEARDRRAVRASWRAGTRAAAGHRDRRGRPPLRRRLVPVHGELPLRARASSPGVSAFDLEDEVCAEWLERSGRAAGRSRWTTCATLPRWEDVVYYRTISPRHFEAAALRVLPGAVRGPLLGRRWSRWSTTSRCARTSRTSTRWSELIRDEDVRRELTENAYRDLIASGEWSYRAVRRRRRRHARRGRSRCRPRTPAVAAKVDAALADRLAPARGCAGARSGACCLVCLCARQLQRADPLRHPVTSRVRRAARDPRLRTVCSSDGRGRLLRAAVAVAQDGRGPPLLAAPLRQSATTCTSTSPCRGWRTRTARCASTRSSGTRPSSAGCAGRRRRSGSA